MSRGLAAAAALLASLVAGAPPVEGQQWVGERLSPTGLSSGGEFGSTVAIAKNGTIAVGDYRHDRVYLFDRDGRQIDLVDLIPGSAGAWFGFDVAIDDERLLVGAPKFGGTEGTGEAYLVKLKDGRAVGAPQPVSGLAPRPGPGDEVGSSVAMDGETLAIGARGADDRRGRVYVGGEGDLTAVPMPLVAQKAELGQSVALSGRTLVMGAPSPFHDSGSPGAAYVFEVGSAGTATPLRLPAGLENEAAFGYAVAVAGDRILVGAPLADRNDAGAVFDFRRQDGGWVPDPQPLRLGGRGDQLGVAVALDGGTVVIGARYADGRRGAAYLMGTSGGPLRPPGAVAGDAQFGFSVAVRGDVAVVGAFRENGTGAAYRFQLVPPVELVVDTEVREVETLLAVGLRTRDGNPVARDVKFRIQTLAGTARERAAEADEGDYLRLDREVTLHAGEPATPVGLLEIRLFPDDFCEEGETFQVILSDPAGTRPQAVEVAIIDDDTAGGLDLSSPALLLTSEDGTSAAPSIRLTCRPAADVTISLRTSDDTEGAVSADPLTFTSANWNVLRAFPVTGQDDALCDGPQTYSVEVRTASADPRYAGLSRSLPAENADDELACLAAEETVCTDAEGTVIYTILLTGPQPPGEPARLVDRLPPEVSVVTASADRGTATADPVANSVRWSGPVPSGTDTVTITIVAALDVPPGHEVRNRADVTYVRDDRGNVQTVRTNEVVFVAGDVIPCPPSPE